MAVTPPSAVVEAAQEDEPKRRFPGRPTFLLQKRHELLKLGWGRVPESDRLIHERAHQADERGPIGSLGRADRERGHGIRTV